MNKKILIIEDNELNIELFCDVLEGNEYEIFKAYNAESGIEIAKQQKPDLILMDLQLPGMDGLEATRILKNNAETSNIIIVALTAFAMEEDIKIAIKSGCDGYITKPINIVEFKKQVESFI